MPDEAFAAMLAGLGGVSAATVARVSGLHRATVGRLRRGEIRNPSLACMIRIERAYQSLGPPTIVARMQQKTR